MKRTVKFSRYQLRNCSLLALGVLLALNSCVTTQDSTYLQVYPESQYSGEYVPPETYLIKTNDNLYIRVSTPDPSLSAIFNVFDQSGGMLQADEASAQLMSYSVELDGTVDIPYAGRVEVAGKTLEEAKQVIEEVLGEYVTDLSVTVKLVNNYVSVLGEINNPGMYPIYKDRLNVFQAIAMAGDVDEFSDRYEISIIRETEGKSIIKEFNITDRNIVDSEFYYIMPNDVIYVKPMKGRWFALNTAPYTFALAVIGTLTTVFILIQNTVLINNQ